MSARTDAEAFEEFEHLTSVGVTPEIAAVLVIGIAGRKVRAIRIRHGDVRGYQLERRRGLITCSRCRAAWRLYLAPYRPAPAAQRRRSA